MVLYVGIQAGASAQIEDVSHARCGISSSKPDYSVTRSSLTDGIFQHRPIVDLIAGPVAHVKF